MQTRPFLSTPPKRLLDKVQKVRDQAQVVANNPWAKRGMNAALANPMANMAYHAFKSRRRNARIAIAVFFALLLVLGSGSLAAYANGHGGISGLLASSTPMTISQGGSSNTGSSSTNSTGSPSGSTQKNTSSAGSGNSSTTRKALSIGTGISGAEAKKIMSDLPWTRGCYTTLDTTIISSLELAIDGCSSSSGYMINIQNIPTTVIITSFTLQETGPSQSSIYSVTPVCNGNDPCSITTPYVAGSTTQNVILVVTATIKVITVASPKYLISIYPYKHTFTIPPQ